MWDACFGCLKCFFKDNVFSLKWVLGCYREGGEGRRIVGGKFGINWILSGFERGGGALGLFGAPSTPIPRSQHYFQQKQQLHQFAQKSGMSQVVFQQKLVATTIFKRLDEENSIFPDEFCVMACPISALIRNKKQISSRNYRFWVCIIWTLPTD